MVENNVIAEDAESAGLLLYEPYSPNSGRTALHFTVNIGTICNLHCDYCYYSELREGHPMSRSELETVLRKISGYMVSSPKRYAKAVFLWYGGEPLLAGKSYFQDVIDLEQEIFPSSIEIVNRVQTNGTLIDEWYAKFFRDHDFGIGLSFDGLPEIHDSRRGDVKGNPTSDRVLHAIKLFKEYGINYQILVVIDEKMLGREEEIYRFLKSLDIDCKEYGADVDFLPVVDMQDPGRSMDPDIYAQFMITMFKIWSGSEGPSPVVRFFKSCVSNMLGFPGKSVLEFKTGCGGAPEIWWNGEVRFCTDAKGSPFYMGNIYTDDLATILAKSDEIKKHLYEERKNCFEGCKWSLICEGGCPLVWHDGRNHFCSTYQNFFPVVKEFAEKIRPQISGGISK